LYEWRVMARETFRIPGVTALDIRDNQNRIRIGIEKPSVQSAIEKELARLGVPRAAVVFEEHPYVRFHKTLRDKFRPTEGGIKTTRTSTGGGECTLGFNAYREYVGGGPVFVTNSHCTRFPGEMESTVFYQFGERIGVEISDPEYYDELVNPHCTPSNYRCRYSDAALVAYDSKSLQRFGYVAQTAYASPDAGSIDVSSTNPRFRIVEERNALMGERLFKMGQRSGWTYGLVVGTCDDYPTNHSTSDGHPIALLCQDAFEGGVTDGDSGSPVFATVSGNDIAIYGILWGGNSSSAKFSSMVLIEAEVGDLKTYGIEP
ncbi:MAG: S1 family peptidase, partial [Gemmatimonadota bacterium]|nr:S1 family peptidase [Gemmatimonadota bacterium]